MDFAPNADQVAALDGLDALLRSDAARWAPSPEEQRFHWSADLDAAVDANGFYDALAEATLGPAAAAEIVYRLSTLPVLVESAASCLLRRGSFPSPRAPSPCRMATGRCGFCRSHARCCAWREAGSRRPRSSRGRRRTAPSPIPWRAPAQSTGARSTPTRRQ